MEILWVLFGLRKLACALKSGSMPPAFQKKSGKVRDKFSEFMRKNLNSYSFSFSFVTVMLRPSSTVENSFTFLTREGGQAPRPITLASIQGFKSETSIHFPAFLMRSSRAFRLKSPF